MAEARVVATTIQHGRARYRVTECGGWQVHLFGWFPTGNNPRWQWSRIDVSKVPEAVRRVSTGNSGT